jgi:hypothetical protein
LIKALTVKATLTANGRMMSFAIMWQMAVAGNATCAIVSLDSKRIEIKT